VWSGNRRGVLWLSIGVIRVPTNRRGYIREYYHRERDKIIKQLGGKCIACGTTDNLHIHHIIPYNGKNHRGRGAIARLLDWKNNMDKICLLCEECHKLYHQTYDPDINLQTLMHFVNCIKEGWKLE